MLRYFFKDLCKVLHLICLKAARGRANKVYMYVQVVARYIIAALLVGGEQSGAGKH